MNADRPGESVSAERLCETTRREVPLQDEHLVSAAAERAGARRPPIPEPITTASKGERTASVIVVSRPIESAAEQERVVAMLFAAMEVSASEVGEVFRSELTRLSEEALVSDN